MYSSTTAMFLIVGVCCPELLPGTCWRVNGRGQMGLLSESHWESCLVAAQRGIEGKKTLTKALSALHPSS